MGSIIITALVKAIAAASEWVACIQSSKGMKYENSPIRLSKFVIEYNIARAKINVVTKEMVSAARIVRGTTLAGDSTSFTRWTAPSKGAIEMTGAAIEIIKATPVGQPEESL